MVYAVLALFSLSLMTTIFLTSCSGGGAGAVGGAVKKIINGGGSSNSGGGSTCVPKLFMDEIDNLHGDFSSSSTYISVDKVNNDIYVLFSGSNNLVTQNYVWYFTAGKQNISLEMTLPSPGSNVDFTSALAYGGYLYFTGTGSAQIYPCSLNTDNTAFSCNSATGSYFNDGTLLNQNNQAKFLYIQDTTAVGTTWKADINNGIVGNTISWSTSVNSSSVQPSGAINNSATTYYYQANEIIDSPSNSSGTPFFSATAGGSFGNKMAFDMNDNLYFIYNNTVYKSNNVGAPKPLQFASGAIPSATTIISLDIGGSNSQNSNGNTLYVLGFTSDVTVAEIYAIPLDDCP